MSLINDALRRTQRTEQARSSAASGLDLRPADINNPPDSGEGGGTKRKVLIVLVVVVVVLNLALWFLFKKQNAATQARARAATENVTVPAAPPSKPRASAPAHEVEASSKASTPNTAHAPTNVAAAAAKPSAANPLPTQVLASRPSLRLQTVVAHPTRPSAMINGRVCFVGDRVAGYTIRRIGQNNATLVKGDDVVVITLP